jgi:hypothetical protein
MASYSPAANAPLPGLGHSSPLAETVNQAFSSISDTLFKLPGSAIILRYIKSSYQGVSLISIDCFYYNDLIRLSSHLVGPHQKSARAHLSHLRYSDNIAEQDQRRKQWY